MDSLFSSTYTWQRHTEAVLIVKCKWHREGLRWFFVRRQTAHSLAAMFYLSVVCVTIRAVRGSVLIRMLCVCVCVSEWLERRGSSSTQQLIRPWRTTEGAGGSLDYTHTHLPLHEVCLPSSSRSIHAQTQKSVVVSIQTSYNSGCLMQTTRDRYLKTWTEQKWDTSPKTLPLSHKYIFMEHKMGVVKLTKIIRQEHSGSGWFTTWTTQYFCNFIELIP